MAHSLSAPAAIAPSTASSAALVGCPPQLGELPLIVSMAPLPEPCLVTANPTMVSLVLHWLADPWPIGYAMLITGEPGSGREFFARCLHRLGRCPQHSFLAVDCATLPPDRAAALILGDDSPGALQQAQGGALFLGNLDALSPALQERLARSIRRWPERTADGRTPDPSFRLLASTSRPWPDDPDAGLGSAALLGHFYCGMVRLPSLRQRPEDIPLLAQHFADDQARWCRRLSVRLSTDALALLQTQDWPGNVRQLKRTIEYAVLHNRLPVIEASNLQRAIDLLVQDDALAPRSPDSPADPPASGLPPHSSIAISAHRSAGAADPSSPGTTMPLAAAPGSRAPSPAQTQPSTRLPTQSRRQPTTASLLQPSRPCTPG